MVVDCSAGTGSSRDALNYRIGGLFGILLTSLIGFALPTYFGDKPSLKFIYYLFQSFASGVVIATGIVHVFADALDSASNPCLYLTQNFPWVCVIVVHATIFTFIGEHVLRRWMTHTWRQKNLAAGDPEKSALTEEELKEGLELQNYKVVAYTLEAGVIFHSVFVGLTLGTSRDVKFVRGLSFALWFHQGFEGIALGAAITKAKLGKFRTLLLGFLFATVTPLGVVAGILFGNQYNGNDKNYLAAEVAFNSISAGILIFNGIVDIIVPTFEDEDSEALKSPLHALLGFFLMVMGSAFMSFIAKWA